MSAPNPHESDLVLGGQNPPPINAAVLGGEAGKKQKLQYKQAFAKENKFWCDFEYLNGLPNSHANIFADRQVVNFEAGMEIINPQNNAYSFHEYYGSDTFESKWFSVLESPCTNEIEALVFGIADWDMELISVIANAKDKLENLKAIFIGDIEDSECMISSLPCYGDISPILESYDRLEFLQMRCNQGRNARTGEKLYEGFRFCQTLRHDKLKILRIESSGLNHQTLLDINQLKLPSLEYLELWLGSPEYGANSSIEDLIPMISSEKFSQLKYLGFKNCDYTDDIAFALAKSPFLENLIELDLSMGTLGNDGLLALLNSPAIEYLDTLNISENFITRGFIENILPTFELNCKLIIDRQECGYESVPRSERYCSVSE
ncbi:hypothetical protein [Chamaesiphon sp. VAR_48_metabat_135_sub]|uniref:hypothetical protein n=1 Tax=Chamaesiphon sp. VAR_48_metabat_135_sub TaxID=2964699 RepID=UPI00286C1F6E|nr:hypothetical protein [Chamaesiphon sp. VAR_48_metabat_135_sub]